MHNMSWGGRRASQHTSPLACCRHLVLAVMHKPSGKWGALGLSRRAQLMDKPVEHSTLSSLVQEYRQAYQRWWHEVLKLRIGLPAPHDATSGEMVGLHCSIQCCPGVAQAVWLPDSLFRCWAE